ncbi:YciN family protein [uncultured Tolumonas sp.]|uniref:YciN family protein n=1 Tax=uncultured Tolumonas sp. TaxID=263765 RepID=UPI002A0A2789|nr:YciN family protein [uncultured Tolumonas sp.]
METKEPIAKASLLELANQIMKEHDDYLAGMTVTDVNEKSGVLVFKGEYFLDDQGLPTAKTTAVFNVYKGLAQALSPQYTLE